MSVHHRDRRVLTAWPGRRPDARVDADVMTLRPVQNGRRRLCRRAAASISRDDGVPQSWSPSPGAPGTRSDPLPRPRHARRRPTGSARGLRSAHCRCPARLHDRLVPSGWQRPAAEAAGTADRCKQSNCPKYLPALNDPRGKLSAKQAARRRSSSTKSHSSPKARARRIST